MALALQNDFGISCHVFVRKTHQKCEGIVIHQIINLWNSFGIFVSCKQI